MPPRRKKTSQVLPEASSDPSGSRSPATNVRANVPPFFNTTFAVYRASPLYIGTEPLQERRLEDLARRLRDTLVGDVVRGIQIGLESTDTPWGQVGPLNEVSFRWFQAKDVIGDDEDDPMNGESSQDRGLWLEIRHDNAAYHALMLPGNGGGESMGLSEKETSWTMVPGETRRMGEKDDSAFLKLPLLLLRMPLALQKAFTEWLSSMFDCNVRKTNLGTRTIASVWETWFKTATLSDGGADIAISLNFNLPGLRKQGNEAEHVEEDDQDPTTGLRSLDFRISPRDLQKFVRMGASMPPSDRKTSPWPMDVRERRQLAGGNSDDGWAWLTDADRQSQPFTEALATYLDKHLALELFHPSVRISQISCDGFVLAQSRLKIVRRGDLTEDLSKAAWAFIRILGDKVKGAEIAAVF